MNEVIQQFPTIEKLIEAICTPPHRFLIAKPDGTEVHREPTVGERYTIKYSYSGETEFYPAVYQGNGMFALVIDDYRYADEMDTPFKLEPHEVEYIEELA